MCVTFIDATLCENLKYMYDFISTTVIARRCSIYTKRGGTLGWRRLRFRKWSFLVRNGFFLVFIWEENEIRRIVLSYTLHLKEARPRKTRPSWGHVSVGGPHLFDNLWCVKEYGSSHVFYVNCQSSSRPMYFFICVMTFYSNMWTLEWNKGLFLISITY